MLPPSAMCTCTRVGEVDPPRWPEGPLVALLVMMLPASEKHPYLSARVQLLRLFADLIRAQHLGKRNPHSSFYAKLAEDFQSPAVGAWGTEMQ